MVESGKIERLGKSELGRHAFETRMPNETLNIITQEDDSNNSYGVIPILANCLKSFDKLEAAYLCNPKAVQVSKIPNEGDHFCGYRNIQMLWISLHLSHKQTLALVKPSIPEVQDMIEQAWDAGINAHGRVQTGGIRGTRKHIGTSEAEAILIHRSIPCTGTAFHGNTAWVQLLDYVEGYFASSPTPSKEGKIHQTNLAPIFLQRPRHSITIVGIERTTSGKRRLLAFDPAWRPPPKQISQLRPSMLCSKWRTYWTLKSYRKEERYLRRFKGFEILVIDSPT